MLALSRAPDDLNGPAADVVRRALRFVRDSQNSDGGWAQRGGRASDPISTAYAVMALCAQEDPRPVADGLQFLLRSQCVDGSIPSESDSIGPRPFIFHVPLLADIFTLMAFGHVRSRIVNTVGGSQERRCSAGAAVAA